MGYSSCCWARIFRPKDGLEWRSLGSSFPKGVRGFSGYKMDWVKMSGLAFAEMGENFKVTRPEKACGLGVPEKANGVTNAGQGLRTPFSVGAQTIGA